MKHKFLKWTHCELLKEYLVGKIVSANFMSPPQLYCYFCFHVDFHVLGDYCCWHLVMLSGEDVAHLQKRRNNKKGRLQMPDLLNDYAKKKELRIPVQIHNVKCTVLCIVQWKRRKSYLMQFSFHFSTWRVRTWQCNGKIWPNTFFNLWLIVNLYEIIFQTVLSKWLKSIMYLKNYVFQRMKGKKD